MPMFDFLFKRRPQPSSSVPAAARQPQPVGPDALGGSMLARQSALKEAAALKDESSAVAFILQCQFADARLQAAGLIQSKLMLEQVEQAMRNADRRVAKLVHGRLDALIQQEARRRHAQVRLDEAQRLVQERLLVPSQVAELDRAWQAIGGPPQELQQSFEQIRAALGERLQEQAALQRAIIDGSARLRGVMDGAQLQADTVADAVQTLDALERELAAHVSAREAPSLPKNMLSGFLDQHHAARQVLLALSAREAASAAREQESARIAEPHQPAPPVDETAPPATEPVAPAPAVSSETRQNLLDAMAGLEQALQDGALHAALEYDKSLRAIDLKAARLSETQAARLAKARGELSRLQGWAKWGGNISREELLKAADGLPAKALAVPELAKQVGSLRERWKSLDTSAGPASKELWERFDAACTAAYAPAAEHFKKLAEERQNNAAKALAIIAEVRQCAASANSSDQDGPPLGDSVTDWKALAAFCARATQAWQRLGTIDRKEKKQLDAEFSRAMQTLSAPLTEEREAEIQRREKLIAQAKDLNPNQRGALENLRALQDRWQEQAKSLPLERAAEQQLWQRFRGACDAVFAQRKEGAAAADAARRQNLDAKEALCALLEAALDADEAAIKTTLREVRDGWSKIAPVPRAAEGQVEARYKSAQAGLQACLDAAKRVAASVEQSTLRAKLQLCRQLEQALVDGVAQDDGARHAWQALALLATDTERALHARFDAASKALQANDRQYASLLERNRAPLAQVLLRCEIVAGVDSPAELSRERLALQVEVLQSSLKAGQKPVSAAAQWLGLLCLPALADAQTCARIDRLLNDAHGGS